MSAHVCTCLHISADANPTAIGFAQQTASVRMPMLVQPPFNYTGSKYRLLPQLMPMFDYSRHTLVDLFTGGGSVWCNLVPYFERAIANDIIRNLVEAQQVLLDGDAIIAETKALCVAKDDKPGYHRLRDDYNVAPTAAKYFALSLCCNNNMARFNASFKFNQTFGRRTWNSSTTEKVSHYTAHTVCTVPVFGLSHLISLESQFQTTAWFMWTRRTAIPRRATTPTGAKTMTGDCLNTFSGSWIEDMRLP